MSLHLEQHALGALCHCAVHHGEDLGQAGLHLVLHGRTDTITTTDTMAISDHMKVTLIYIIRFITKRKIELSGLCNKGTEVHTSRTNVVVVVGQKHCVMKKLYYIAEEEILVASMMQQH